MKEINNSEKREEIDNEVIKLYEQNYNSAQIRKALLKKFTGMGESVPTIIDRLKKEGRISTENREGKSNKEKGKKEQKIEAKEARKGRIKELKEAGMYNKEIANQEGILESAVWRIIQELREEGNLDEEKVERAREEREKQKITEQTKENEEGTKPITSARKIAEADKEVSRYLRDLIEQINEKKEDIPQQKSSAKEKNKTDKNKSPKKKGKTDKNKSSKEEKQYTKRTNKPKIGKSYIVACRKSSKENDEKQDTAKLRQSIELDYDKVTMNDIVFVINVHLKQHEYRDAIIFLNSLISFEAMEQIDNYYLEGMKKQIEHMVEVDKVRKLLSKGISKQDIEAQVKLSGFEINKIANQLRNEQQEAENDDIENNGR